MKEEKIGLEQYYPGDQKWLKFVKTYEEDWNGYKEQQKLLKLLNNQKDLAKVIYGIYANNCFSYLNKPIPALDDLKPIECLENEKLRKRLKVCLTRSYR